MMIWVGYGDCPALHPFSIMHKQAMESIIEHIRTLLVVCIATIMSALAPTANALLLLIIFGLVNMFMGWQANWMIHRERFKFSKFWLAMKQLMFYMVLVILIHLSFYLFDKHEWSVIAVRLISWIAVWAYLVKTLQNFLLIFPKTRGVRLLYNLIAVKFIPRLLGYFGIDYSHEEMEQFNNDFENTKDREHDEKDISDSDTPRHHS